MESLRENPERIITIYGNLEITSFNVLSLRTNSLIVHDTRNVFCKFLSEDPYYSHMLVREHLLKCFLTESDILFLKDSLKNYEKF
jgi:hypothetical protein